MSKLILNIYDLFRRRRWLCLSIFAALTAVLVALVMTLHYKEDISDFLPLDHDNQQAMSVYQDISGANRIYAFVMMRDSAQNSPERLAEGVDLLTQTLAETDTAGLLPDVISSIDLEQIMGVVSAVYDDIPYFMTERDYARADSLLAIPGYTAAQLMNDKEQLQSPAAGFSVETMSRDPLGLFSPVAARIHSGGSDIEFDNFDGYILSPDWKRAIVMMDSRFGASESDNNGRIVDLLNAVKRNVEQQDPAFDVHFTGGPVIAVGNADRIKKDSILAGTIAGVLILALLIYVFRNMLNILLIVVSVGWGWLFAMGGIAIFYDSVSIIVIGISSVILGIAINYPLHLIDHLAENPNRRLALREIVSPLVVGNVTTVGAFLCLVPLNATALHDLGLFSSLLLVGTILFVLLFLPQLVRKNSPRVIREEKRSVLSRLADIKPERSKPLVIVLSCLTLVFAWFSLDTGFDTDMRNINYMTPQNRADMEYFSSLMPGGKTTEPLYVVSEGKSWDEAMRGNEHAARVLDGLAADGKVSKRSDIANFLPSGSTQQARLKRWNRFVTEHSALFRDSLPAEAARLGFSEEAFAPFHEAISQQYTPKSFDELNETFTMLFAGNISRDDAAGRKAIVQIVDVPKNDISAIKDRIKERFDGLCFDVASMNSSIANTLSDDFNYICYACGFIVFAFLWLSFGRIELAAIAFLPMALSWLWILGIMAICDIRFNIVNVILATFIFGQGDDYTIFITEGLAYEYAYRRKVLASYKNSIVVSALIMFIGIGSLIFAQHPAMRSLGQVTVVGMIAVVLMAYIVPPLFFNWITRSHGHVRRHPITLASLCMQVFRPRRYKALQQALAAGPMSPDMMEYAVSGRYLYKDRDIESNAKKALKGIIPHLDELKDANADDLLVINGTAQGELALTLALLHPDVSVTVVTDNEDSHALIETCAIDFTPNITVITNNNDYEKLPDSYVRLYSDGNAVAYARRRPA